MTLAVCWRINSYIPEREPMIELEDKNSSMMLDSPIIIEIDTMNPMWKAWERDSS
jgi:hypothetical protein